MQDNDWLAAQFEAQRQHLRAVAYRMLGSVGEAEDAVQEAWLRLSRTDASEVDNLAGWLTTVVARVSLDVLRSRRTRREESLDAARPPSLAGDDVDDPEEERMLADSVGPALLVVLDALTPSERLAFVLHDLFGVPFEDIAAIVGKSPMAARQLASRARRRVQGADVPAADIDRRRELVDAFLLASREGDFSTLLAVLAPDVVLRADQAAVQASEARQAQGAPKLASETRGARAVAEVFSGRARAARPALVEGVIGAAWIVDGTARAAFAFEIAGDRIAAIEVISDPQRLAVAGVSALA